MANLFSKHYTLEEARSLLPQVRQWLEQMARLQEDIAKQEEQLDDYMAAGGDLGGPLVNQWVRSLSTFRDVLMEFYSREIQVKDLERGLIDFPAIRSGREVFLCWERGEPDIEFWHDLDAGYAGRERL